MNAFWAVPAMVLLFGTLPALAAAELPPADQLRVLERKVVGAWIGQSPCAGNLVFQPDGTYHYSEFGPGAGSFEVGTWKIQWNELPPTLVMVPAPAEPAESRKPWKVHLVRLNDKHLDFRQLPPYSPRTDQHRRGTARDDVAIRIRILDSAVQRYLGTTSLGAGVNLPPNLKTLVDKKVLRPESLVDPWGKEFHYDVSGKRNKGKRPDVWTETPDGKETVGNWSGRE